MISFKHLLLISAASLLAGTPAFAGATIGQAAPDFTLTDTLGKTHSLSDYKGKVVVLEWINDGCPFVQRHYRKTNNMQTLQKTYTDKGVIWLTICSSARGQQGNHPPEEWEAIRQKQGHHSTALLLDEPGKVGRAYGAKTTPHMYVINEDGILVYNGAIDSNESDPAKAEPYFKNALEDVLAGREVAVPTKTPYGCNVKYDS